MKTGNDLRKGELIQKILGGDFNGISENYWRRILNSQTLSSEIARSSQALNALINSPNVREILVISPQAMRSMFRYPDVVSILMSSLDMRELFWNSDIAWELIQSDPMVVGKFVAAQAGLDPAAYADIYSIANSTTAMTAVADSPAAMDAVVVSKLASSVLANSSTAVNKIVGNSNAMSKIINNSLSFGIFSSSPIMKDTLLNSTDPFGDGKLFAKFKFDGDAIDLLGHSVTWPGTEQYTTGVIGQAALFDGGSWLVGDSYTLLEWAGITFLAFVRFDNTTATAEQIVGFDASGCDVHFRRVSENNLLFDVYNSPVSTTVSPVIPSEFHFYAVSFNKQTVKFYRDGNVVETFSLNKNFPTGGGYFFIGKGYYSSEALLKGAIDQLEVYQRALTDNEIAFLYAVYTNA